MKIKLFFLPRIVSDRHQSRLEALLKQTKGKVAFGGKSDPNDKFLSPTVVSDVKLDDALMKVRERRESTRTTM